MKIKHLAIVSLAMLAYGCEEKPAFKILTPVEACVQNENLPLALCECIYDAEKMREPLSAGQNTHDHGGSDLQTSYQEPGVFVNDDGSIGDARSLAKLETRSGSGWEGTADNMMSAMANLNSSLDARRENCLQAMEIK